MKNRFLFILALLFTASGFAAPPDEGKNLFQARCAACHNVNRELTGPALAGIDQRRPIDWIINFVHSSRAVIKGGDGYAVALYDKFNKVQMPDHPDLTGADIKEIVTYIKAATLAVPVDKGPFAIPGKIRPGFLPLDLQKDYGIMLIYLAAVGMLIACLLFAVQLTRINKAQTENRSQ